MANNYVHYPSGVGLGSVTSVALTLPNIFTVTGSPITTSGTLAATFANQTQNKVFASPNGSTGTPSFRALVAGDVPSLAYANQTLSNLTSPTAINQDLLFGSDNANQIGNSAGSRPSKVWAAKGVLIGTGDANNNLNTLANGGMIVSGVNGAIMDDGTTPTAMFLNSNSSQLYFQVAANTHILNLALVSPSHWTAQLGATTTLTWLNDGDSDIGNTSSHRPANIWAATSVNAPALVGTTSATTPLLSGTTSTTTPLVQGGTSASGNLTLSSTTNSTKGLIQALDGTTGFIDNPDNPFQPQIAAFNAFFGAYPLIITENPHLAASVALVAVGGSDSPNSIDCYNARGTFASPTQLLNNDSIGQFDGLAYDGNGSYAQGTVGDFLGGAGMFLRANEDHTPTALGTKIVFGVTANGTTTFIPEVMHLQADNMILTANAASSNLFGIIWATDAQGDIGRPTDNRPRNIYAESKVIATGGLGVGNSAVASTPGTVVKKIEIFDASGTSLGFIAVYDAIT